jgi:SAM-dependent methyltransferase
MFAEISRLLKPGGLFVASYDYWPEKISTDRVVSFGMEWIIFSKSEVVDMVNHAANYGLTLLDPSQDLEANEPHIRYNGFNYTFGLVAFIKK